MQDRLRRRGPGDVPRAVVTLIAGMSVLDATIRAHGWLQGAIAGADADDPTALPAPVPDYLAGVPLYREANRRFLGLSPDALAGWLAGELIRAGVARRHGERLCAT